MSVSDLTSIGQNTTTLTALAGNSSPSTMPSAYLNYALFDDQFKYVTGDVDAVKTSQGHKDLNKLINAPVTINKSGYIYILYRKVTNTIKEKSKI